MSHDFVAPVGASLRVASRVRIEPSGHSAHGWSNLLLLRTTNGDVWSVDVGGGYTGDDRVAFDAYRNDPSGAHDASVAPGIAYGTGRTFCPEATLAPVPAGLAVVDGGDGPGGCEPRDAPRAGSVHGRRSTPGAMSRADLPLAFLLR